MEDSEIGQEKQRQEAPVGRITGLGGLCVRFPARAARGGVCNGHGGPRGGGGGGGQTRKQVALWRGGAAEGLGFWEWLGSMRKWRIWL